MTVGNTPIHQPLWLVHVHKRRIPFRRRLARSCHLWKSRPPTILKSRRNLMSATRTSRSIELGSPTLDHRPAPSPLPSTCRTASCLTTSQAVLPSQSATRETGASWRNRAYSHGGVSPAGLAKGNGQRVLVSLDILYRGKDYNNSKPSAGR